MRSPNGKASFPKSKLMCRDFMFLLPNNSPTLFGAIRISAKTRIVDSSFRSKHIRTYFAVQTRYVAGPSPKHILTQIDILRMILPCVKEECKILFPSTYTSEDVGVSNVGHSMQATRVFIRRLSSCQKRISRLPGEYPCKYCTQWQTLGRIMYLFHTHLINGKRRFPLFRS